MSRPVAAPAPAVSADADDEAERPTASATLPASQSSSVFPPSTATGFAAGAVNDASEPPELSINDRLQILEKSAWYILKCETPEDVVDKLTCEEVQPALSSGHQIAEDPHQVWLGNINFVDQASLLPSKPRPRTEMELGPAVEADVGGRNHHASNDTEAVELDDEALLLADEFGDEYAAEMKAAAARKVGVESPSHPLRLTAGSTSAMSAYASSMMDSNMSFVSPLASPHLGEVIIRHIHAASLTSHITELFFVRLCMFASGPNKVDKPCVSHACVCPALRAPQRQWCRDHNRRCNSCS